MSTKETQEKLVTGLKAWQELEDATIAITGQTIAKTKNPVVRSIMEIILNDSQSHRRVQQLVLDSLEGVVVLTPDELGDIWGLIEKHVEMEKHSVELATELLGAIKGTKMLVPQYVLEYLLQDEQKHENLLNRLEAFKAGMYPYA